VTHWLRVRWGVDRGVALVVLLVLAPVWGAIWVAIRLLDGPPAIVRLRRVGQHGVPFLMAKFRSMRVDRADGRAAGHALTTGHDERVTPWGRRLRHYRLDELPQLGDVVAGRMSLIGPRPEAPGYVDLQDARWERVLQARPGIAGATQVVIVDLEAGLGIDDLERYEAEMLPVKLAVDQWYLDHASPTVDALIVWSVVQRFALRRRITAMHRRLVRELPIVADMVQRLYPEAASDGAVAVDQELASSPR
jgi:lipopolysaccharide/colanic/teichoic acid biosynthesis glycosyltransferase